MIAGFAKIFNFQPEFSFAEIGEQFPDNKYLALRFLPNLAGALLPLVIFLLALQLKFSAKGAFAAGLFIALENALLVQTHYILLDGFLLLFGFLALLFCFRKKLLWMSVFGALAISIKWTGLTFLVLPLFLEAWRCFINRSYGRFIKQGLIFFFIIPFAIYFSVFALHFSLLTKSGPGDAFMTVGFHNENIVKKFLELNVQMYFSNQRLTATHPYGSEWFSWPLMARPIYYWVSGNSKIYLLGNPVIWWGSTIAIAIGLVQIAKRKAHDVSKKSRFAISDWRLAFLLGGYFLNLLPFIGVRRVMFLYHYLTALIFAILMLCYLIDQNKNSRKIFTGIVVIAFVAFLFFAPLSYGLPLSPPAYDARVWLPSWR